jgi:hypothetical protein
MSVLSRGVVAPSASRRAQKTFFSTIKIGLGTQRGAPTSKSFFFACALSRTALAMLRASKLRSSLRLGAFA